MPSTKRYYTLQEIAALLHVPIHQARRWVKLFLTLPSHKTVRIPAEALPLLRRAREGAYIYRLRGDALLAFVQRHTAPPAAHPPYPDYPLLLREILQEIETCLAEMEPPPA